MSEPSQKLERYGHIGESGLTRIRVQTRVDQVGRPQYAEVCKCVNGEWASELVRIHNAHAALVEACENAWNWFEVDEPKSAVQVVEQIRAALAKARPGKE